MSTDAVGFNSNKIIVSVPACEEPASVGWAINLASQFYPSFISIEYSSQDGWGEDPDILKNHTVGYALATNARYIWFVKNNILPPNWAVHRLLEAMRADDKIMVAAAMCETNVPESTEFSDCLKIFVDENKNEFELLEVAPDYHVGLECTLVKTEVFNKIPEPWFKSTELVKSDSYFCHKVMEAGYKICTHSGVMCGYVDMNNGRSMWPNEVVVPA